MILVLHYKITARCLHFVFWPWPQRGLYLRISVCLSVTIVQFWVQTSTFQHLIIWFRWNLAHLSFLGCRLRYWCRNCCQKLSSAVNSCFSSCYHRKLVLEASNAKVCLAKYSGNSLDMNFEYWNFSVAQKLFFMDFFLFQLSKLLSWVSAYLEVTCISLEVLWCHLRLNLGAVNCW